MAQVRQGAHREQKRKVGRLAQRRRRGARGDPRAGQRAEERADVREVGPVRHDARHRLAARRGQVQRGGRVAEPALERDLPAHRRRSEHAERLARGVRLLALRRGRRGEEVRQVHVQAQRRVLRLDAQRAAAGV